MTQEISAERERLARLEGAYEHLATKADVERVRINIEQLRSELGREIGQVRSELGRDIEQVRSELGRDIEQVRSELRALKWVIGIGIGAAGAIGPLLTWLLEIGA